MRVKRQKKNRRTVRFFTVCYGFRQPYKVLCDGTFVHHLVTNEITPADTAVSELLGGPVKLFTTRFISLIASSHSRAHINLPNFLLCFRWSCYVDVWLRSWRNWVKILRNLSKLPRRLIQQRKLPFFLLSYLNVWLISRLWKFRIWFIRFGVEFVIVLHLRWA